MIKELRIPESVPQEIRDQIARHLCAPKFHHYSYYGDLRADWFLALGTISPSILRAGVAAWYGSKELIIELTRIYAKFTRC